MRRQVEYFFTYILRHKRTILRIGKGHVFSKSTQDLQKYLKRRYPSPEWQEAQCHWHSSESAALQRESVLIQDYVDEYGQRPAWNQRGGGGGRQIYARCKKIKNDGNRCTKNALEGNYGFCGIHRKLSRRFMIY